MGQQQLLLIILGIMTIAIAILIGMSLFSAQSVEAKRNNITHDLVTLSAMAQQYYLKPTQYGGGGRRFTGWTIPSSLADNDNAHFNAVVNSGSIVITGTGKEVITGNDSIKVQITVYPQSYQTVILN